MNCNIFLALYFIFNCAISIHLWIFVQRDISAREVLLNMSLSDRDVDNMDGVSRSRDMCEASDM